MATIIPEGSKKATIPVDITIVQENIVIPATSNLAKQYWKYKVGSNVNVFIDISYINKEILDLHSFPSTSKDVEEKHEAIRKARVINGIVREFKDAGGIKDSLRIGCGDIRHYYVIDKYLPDDAKDIFWVPSLEDLMNIAFDTIKNLTLTQLRRYKKSTYLLTSPSMNTLVYGDLKMLMAMAIAQRVESDKSLLSSTIGQKKDEQ